jgi:hypothetical protein
MGIERVGTLANAGGRLFGGNDTLELPIGSAAPTRTLVVVRAAQEDDGVGIVGITDSAGNSYTQQETRTRAGALILDLWTAYLTLPLAPGDRIYVQGGSADLSICGRADAYRVVDDTVDQNTGANGSSTSPASGNITTTSADELICAAVAMPVDPAGASFTQGTGWTPLDPATTGNLGANPEITIFAEDRIEAATGTFNGDGTLSASQPWAALVVSFQRTPLQLGAASSAQTQTGTASAFRRLAGAGAGSQTQVGVASAAMKLRGRVARRQGLQTQVGVASAAMKLAGAGVGKQRSLGKRPLLPATSARIDPAPPAPFGAFQPPASTIVLNPLGSEGGQVAIIGGTRTLIVPRIVPAGSILIVRTAKNENGTAVTLSDTRGNSYTQLVERARSGACRVGIYRCVVTTTLQIGDFITAACHNLAAPAALAFQVDECPVDVSSTLNVTASADGSSTSPSSGNAVTTTARCLLLGAVAVGVDEATYSFTPGSGWTAGVAIGSGDQLGDPECALYTEDRTVLATGSYAANGTLSGSTPWAAAEAALELV